MGQDQICDGVTQLSLDDQQRKENINIVFIGHVDSGKSTTAGRIMSLTGMVDKRTLEKLEKESKELNRDSWIYAYILDTDEDEKEKGITVHCGKAFFETPKRRFTILDAPGHKSYVPNMITGAAQADIAVLIISARKGEFETGFEKGGQTREHAMLVKTIGIRKLIVAINKMDEPSVAWAKERYDEIVGKLTPFLKGIGMNLKTEVEFMPISGFTGANLQDKLDSSVCSWYNGPSLLGYLDEMPIWDRNIGGPFLMPISEKYKDNGTIIGGKIESGRITRGQNILIMPSKKTAEVQGILCEDTELKDAQSGDNIKLKLKGVDEEEVFTGNVACSPERPVKIGTLFEVQVVLLNCKNIVTPGYISIMHIHLCSEEVSFEEFISLIDKKTGAVLPKRPFARQGEILIARLLARNPVCMEIFSEHPQLGRFSLRDEGKTVAMGKILKIIS